jgi:hypothetical protein
LTDEKISPSQQVDHGPQTSIMWAGPVGCSIAISKTSPTPARLGEGLFAKSTSKKGVPDYNFELSINLSKL